MLQGALSEDQVAEQVGAEEGPWLYLDVVENSRSLPSVLDDAERMMVVDELSSSSFAWQSTYRYIPTVLYSSVPTYGSPKAGIIL
jgi:hypothetical protein